MTVRPCAITDRTGSVELHLPPPQADGTVETSASVESDFKEVVERTVTVDGRTLDDAWITEGRPDVSLVKIDVEGAEHRVLAGADLVVASCRPVLSIEVLPSAHLDEIDAFRDRHDYVDVTLTPTDAVVNHPTITYHSDAPNHLLVPRGADRGRWRCPWALGARAPRHRARLRRAQALGVAAARTRRQ